MNATNETTTLQIPAATIELHPGERYAGPVLDADGHIKHYLHKSFEGSAVAVRLIAAI